MRKLIFFSLLSIGIVWQGAYAGPPATPHPPQGTTAELSAGTVTFPRTWAPKTLADQFSGATTEVSDATVGVTGNTVTNKAYSQDDIHDYVAQHDSDFDGLPDGVEQNAIDQITDITAALKSGADGTLLTGTAGTNTYTAVWNADGDLVDGFDPATVVLNSAFNAQTVLAATADNTPLPLTVSEQTVVGRATGGNVAALLIDSDLSSVSANHDTLPSAKGTRAYADLMMPLTGGTFSGEIVVSSSGVEFAESDSFSNCSSFAATGGGIFYDDSEGKFKKCQDNVLTDLDTDTGGATAYNAIGDPTTAASITFDAAGETGTYTSATDGWGGIIISNTTADNASDTTLLTLSFDDSADANSIWLSVIDDADGTALQIIKGYGRTLQITGVEIALQSGSSITGIDSIAVDTAITPDAADSATVGTAALEFSDAYFADAAVLYFGADQDVTLTHVPDTGLLLNAAMQVQFRDSAIHIESANDGHLDLTADTMIDLNGAVSGSSTIFATTSFISPLFDASGASAITFGSPDVTLFTFSGQSETLTLTPSGNTFALNTTTGVTSVSMNTIDLQTTGKISGGVITNTKAAGYTIGTDDAREMYGGIIYVTTNATIVLPAVAAGMNVSIINITTGATITLDPNASDLIRRDGVAQADGVTIVSPAGSGDMCVITYYSADGWYAATNGWTQGS